MYCSPVVTKAQKWKLSSKLRRRRESTALSAKPIALRVETKDWYKGNERREQKHIEWKKERKTPFSAMCSFFSLTNNRQTKGWKEFSLRKTITYHLRPYQLKIDRVTCKKMLLVLLWTCFSKTIIILTQSQSTIRRSFRFEFFRLTGLNSDTWRL